MIYIGSDFRINSKNESKNGTEPGYSNFLKLRYSLNSTNYRENEAVRLWELKFIENIRKIDAQDPILICSDKNKVDNKIRMRISYSVSSSLDIEMVVNLKFDKIMISCTFVLIFVLATCLMSINTTWITAPGILLASAGFYFKMLNRLVQHFRGSLHIHIFKIKCRITLHHRPCDYAIS